jgi:hypothetical protein
MAKVGRPRKKRPSAYTRQQILLGLERRRKALELRMQGATYKEIGVQLGCTALRAGQLVRDIMQTRIAELDDLVREQAELQNARLDVAVKALWPEILKGDCDSINALIRVEERRARLHGLDAPQKIQAEVDLRQMPAEELLAIAKRIGLGSVVVSGADGQIEELTADEALRLAAAMPAEPPVQQNLLDRLAAREVQDRAELEPDIQPLTPEPLPLSEPPLFASDNEPASVSSAPEPPPGQTDPSAALPP